MAELPVNALASKQDVMAKREAWHKAMLDQGHIPQLAFNHLDMFAYASGSHSGPMCTKCGWYRCWHCERDVTTIPKCIDTSDIPEVGPEWFAKAKLVKPKSKRARRRQKRTKS